MDTATTEPSPIPAQRRNAETDTDGDGFIDENDTCPTEGNMGFGIDEFGCPLDNDKDGYPDHIDTCPTEGDMGVGLDEFGCPIMASPEAPQPTPEITPASLINTEITESVAIPTELATEPAPEITELMTFPTESDVTEPAPEITPMATEFISQPSNSISQPESATRVIPFVDCITINNDQTITAYFGYDNFTDDTLIIALGVRNFFVPVPAQRGQPITFTSGYYSKVFSVTFDATSEIAWSLDTVMATANSNTPLCDETEQDPDATPEPTEISPIGDERLRALIECIKDNQDGTLTAYFGYQNFLDTSLSVALGVRNFFVPAPAQRGQPIVFLPGRHGYVFSVTFDATSEISWTLDGESITANANRRSCRVSPESTPVVTPTEEITPVVTPTEEITPVVTPTEEITPVITPTEEITPVVTPTEEITPVVTPTEEITPVVTPTEEITPVVTPTEEITPIVTPTEEITPVVTNIPEIVVTSDVPPTEAVTDEPIITPTTLTFWGIAPECYSRLLGYEKGA